MPLENGTRCSFELEHLQIVEEFDEVSAVGRENRSLDRVRENTKKNVKIGVAERVGVFQAVLENPNEDGPFQRNARDANDLASSNFCRPLRPFASVCRFFPRDVTRHGTRRGGLGRRFPEGSDADAAKTFPGIVLR